MHEGPLPSARGEALPQSPFSIRASSGSILRPHSWKSFYFCFYCFYCVLFVAAVLAAVLCSLWGITCDSLCYSGSPRGVNFLFVGVWVYLFIYLFLAFISFLMFPFSIL